MMMWLQPIGVVVLALSPGRIGALTGGLLGLIGLVAGARALARGTQSGARVALLLGMVGSILGALVVATAQSGVGTGAGVGGGYVAIVVGLTGVILGAVGLVRSRRTASPN